MDLLIAVNNIESLSVATETKEWVPFALVSSYRTLVAAVNNKKLIRSLYEVPKIFVLF